jgi:probable phosphoglycerate mutase
VSTVEKSSIVRLVLIRHGESVVTVQRVIGGLRTCVGLSPLGRQQAEALRSRLERTNELRPDVLLSSTMPRAVQTADIIAPALGSLPVMQDPMLCEQDPGECDGLTFAAYVDKYGSPGRWDDPDADIFPGGETVRAFHRRVATGIDAVVAAHGGRSVVVACHGGVIDAALRHLLGVTMTGSFQLHTLNTSITELTHRDGLWRLDRYNDSSHLHGLPAETTPGSMTDAESAAE